MWKNEYNTTISDVKSTIPPEDQRQTKFLMFVNLSWWKKLLLDGQQRHEIYFEVSLSKKRRRTQNKHVNIVRFAQPVTFVRLRLHHNLLDVTNLKRSCHSA